MSLRIKRITTEIEQRILLKSKRRCALCFYDEGKDEPQIGHIAHLDRNPQHNGEDNLVFLCMQHHALLDSDTQSRISEIKAARHKLYEAMDQEDSISYRGNRDAQAFDDKVAEYVREQFISRLGDFFSLHRNIIFHGRSGVSYEVDIATRFNIGDLRFFTIFEIKNRRNPATPSDLLEFIARSTDLGADKGVFICAGGFSAGAVHVANANGITLIQANRTGELEPANDNEGAKPRKIKRGPSGKPIKKEHR